MARVAWVNIPDEKHIWVSLTYIYWIWRSRAIEILEKIGIKTTTKTNTISEEDLDKIRDTIKEYLVEWDLRREVTNNIKRLKEIKCYRWLRHIKRLPVRGQRTKTNSRTRKWKATAIANKKK